MPIFFKIAILNTYIPLNFHLPSSTQFECKSHRSSNGKVRDSREFLSARFAINWINTLERQGVLPGKSLELPLRIFCSSTVPPSSWLHLISHSPSYSFPSPRRSKSVSDSAQNARWDSCWCIFYPPLRLRLRGRSSVKFRQQFCTRDCLSHKRKEENRVAPTCLKNNAEENLLIFMQIGLWSSTSVAIFFFNFSNILLFGNNKLLRPVLI